MTAMNRSVGLTLVAGLVLAWSSTTQAQTFPTDYHSQGGSDQGAYGYGDLPFGGFGYQYTQGPPVSGIVMDRWGQVIGTTYPASTPVITTEQPLAEQPVARQNARIRVFRKAQVQPRYAVTTGSLGVSGSNGFGYATGMRDRSYGLGYELSPYGTTQYYGPWKGLILGY